jgi:cytochrome b involved in lipid metabolism
MKSFLILSLSVLLLTACGQKTDISEAPTEDKVEQNSPILPTPSTSGKEIEAKTTEATNIDIADDEEPIGTIAKTGFTAAEVAEHSTADDCWLILDGKVYEVTEFIPSHPGGKAILKGCGKDATQMFAGHPESAKAMKEKYYIGDLKS